MNTFDKYWFCKRHPKFINPDFVEVEILIDPHMVCKQTKRIEDYKPLNTEIQYWVEFCPPWYDEDIKKWIRSHDMECDCGGWTYDEAIDNLYNLVLEKYGDYTEQDIDDREEEVFKYSNMNIPSYMVHSNYRSIEDRSFKDSMVDFVTKTFIHNDIQNLHNYKKALTDFMETATVQQVEEIKLILVAVEHDLFTHEMTQKTGLDFT